MADVFEILCGVALVLLLLYYYCTSTFNFWKSRGIAGPQPMPFFGNFTLDLSKKMSMSDLLKVYYDQYKHEPVFGLYQLKMPVLVVNDLELIKDILIRDFSLFASRGLPIFLKAEPLSAHLFNLDVERWRQLRTKLSPTFTSGKLKEMFPMIVECSVQLDEYVNKLVEKGEPVECRDLAAKFTTDVIGNCAFGIETKSITDEDSEFRRMGKEIFTLNTSQQLRMHLRQSLPFFYNLFGYWIQQKSVNDFFIKITSDTMNYREENNIVRPDFINTLIELKNHPEKLENMELTDTFLTSQAFVFFVAGFETSSTTISHALYELALNPHIQDKLRAEIREHYEKNGENLKYEHVKQMTYLDKVFKETLRKYPVLPMLMRQVSENYTFKNTKITIPKDTHIWIPVYPIHRDPNIYSEPDTFDPERFSEEALAERHSMSYLPFGDGPRNCIGARFAINQTKIGIITVLRNHKFETCEKTTLPYKSEPKAFLLTLQNGVHLTVSNVKS